MVVINDLLLMEDGDYLLQENGDKIILVFIAPPPAVTPIKRLSAAWFGVPEMRKKVLGKEKVYLKEDYVDKLR